MLKWKAGEFVSLPASCFSSGSFWKPSWQVKTRASGYGAPGRLRLIVWGQGTTRHYPFNTPMTMLLPVQHTGLNGSLTVSLVVFFFFFFFWGGGGSGERGEGGLLFRFFSVFRVVLVFVCLFWWVVGWLLVGWVFVWLFFFFFRGGGGGMGG